MSSIQRFEDLDVWKKARELTFAIYDLTKNTDLAKDYGLREQTRRASVSIMANIAEGFERGGNKEFMQFLSIAKASAAEVRSHLYVALDQVYMQQKEFDGLIMKTEEISKMLSGFSHYLSNSQFKGNKYKISEESERLYEVH